MEQTAKERTLAFMAEHAGDPTPMELFHMHVKHVGINTKSEGEAWEVAEARTTRRIPAASSSMGHLLNDPGQKSIRDFIGNINL